MQIWSSFDMHASNVYDNAYYRPITQSWRSTVYHFGSCEEELTHELYRPNI